MSTVVAGITGQFLKEEGSLMAVNESISKLVDKEWEDKPVAEIVAASTAALQGLTDERAQKIAEALGAKTIKDLANNKYVRWAQALTNIAEFE